MCTRQDGSSGDPTPALQSAPVRRTLPGREVPYRAMIRRTGSGDGETKRHSDLPVPRSTVTHLPAPRAVPIRRIIAHVFLLCLTQ